MTYNVNAPLMRKLRKHFEQGFFVNNNNSAQAKTAKGRARIDKILEAARQLFTDGGYGEMTMRQVADRVGISLSNVQHYFPSRESLLRALLESVMNSYAPAFEAAGTKFATPQEHLVAVLRYLLADIKRAESERLFVEIWSLATRDPVAREIFDMMYTHHRQALEELIARAYPALPVPVRQRRTALVAMQIEGLMLLISEGKPQHAELAGIEDECVAAVLRILEAPAPESA